MCCVRFLFCKVLKNGKSSYINRYLKNRWALVGFSWMEEGFFMFF